MSGEGIAFIICSVVLAGLCFWARWIGGSDGGGGCGGGCGGCGGGG